MESLNHKAGTAGPGQKVNYQKQLDQLLEALQKEGRVPRLLLHACCAPCSSYCMEYLASHFHITMFFYNPNISEAAEYEKRRLELTRLIGQMPFRYPVEIISGAYDPQEFYEKVPDRRNDREGGESCFQCYELRLQAAAQAAKNGGFDFFSTTLSISPLKNAAKLNEIGGRLAEEYGVPYLFSDFKKKNGYKRSIELSAQYGLYRQNYCGCIFSKREALERNQDQ